MDNSTLIFSEGTALDITLNTFSVLFAIAAFYLNVVFIRASTNTPLLHRNCRYTVRATAYLNCLFCIILALSGLINYNGDSDSIHMAQFLFSWLNSMTIVFPFFTILERFAFAESAKYRENEKHGAVAAVKMVSFFFCLSCCFTLACVAHYLQDFDRTQFVAYQILNAIIGLPIVFLLVILFFIIKDKNRKFSLKGGVLVEKRRTEIKEEQIQLNYSIAPYLILLCVFLFLEFAIYVSADRLYQETGLLGWFYRLLLHSVRVTCAPVSLVVFNEMLRDDFRSNFLVWKEVKQRTSKMKVVHFTSRESQEVILNNFKMMGLIGDHEDEKQKQERREKRRKSSEIRKSSESRKSSDVRKASKAEKPSINTPKTSTTTSPVE